MRTFMITTAAILGLSTAVYAEPVFLGYGEYAVEADEFEFGLGAEFGAAEELFIVPMLIATSTDGNFELDRVEVDVEYVLNKQVNLYAEIETDGDLNYVETTLGADFSF